ncbi:MAG: GNAT family N-acetyltransferase [Oligoflexia bacterium]|nr:GNAT family N-acetyltransferase [Oligoflexia bacterium]
MEIEKAKILSRFGFYLVDTNVQLKLEPQNYKHNIKPEVCFYAGPEHQDGVLQVASDSFLYSRFHLDPMFNKEMANKIKLEWCRSFFSGTRGQKMVVAQVEGKILGFLLLIDKGQGHWIIDLIAVSPKAQKLKLGSQMISNALQDNNIKLMSVGTQIANIPSLNFYEKNGFTFESAKYVYHYHGE